MYKPMEAVASEQLVSSLCQVNKHVFHTFLTRYSWIIWCHDDIGHVQGDTAMDVDGCSLRTI